MKFKEFLKEKLITIFLLIFAIITIEIFLLIYKIDIYVKIYIPIIIMLTYLIGIIIEYYKKKSFYDKLLNNLEKLDQKYLIPEIIESTDFIEGNILKEVLEETNKSMLENVNKYKYLHQEYKEYIELWIHEIKLPIATSKMVIENNKNEITQSINEELNKIENYVEQALYYARSNTVEKDYCIKKANLKEIVNETIRRNKDILISENIKIDINNIEQVVYTDTKWCVFILNQIIANCIKYSKHTDKLINIYAEEKKDKVILYIKDNGIGIRKGEITRVFEKGFTGTNGRLVGKKSTGIGLYLCKKLCDKLGLGIELNSIENKETEIRVIFPKNSYIEM